MPENVQRKLAAMLSADVVGYSRLMAEDEVETVHTLTAYREVTSTLIRQHHGRVVDSPGDNLLAEFPSALDAVRAAVEVQRVIKARNTAVPEGRRMQYRIGVHLGDVMVEGERIYGDGVNIAARLEALAETGGICISGAVHEQVETKGDLTYEDLGDQSVKNIPRPIRVFRVRTDEPTAKAPTWWPSRRVLVVAGVIALLGLGRLLAGVLGVFDPHDPRLPDVPSIAVLPFENMSGDPEQEYFSDGLTEDLITDLSKISGLIVIARNSVFTYKGRSVRVEDVGRELGVRFVLEGSVRKAGDRIRVTAQLVNAENGHHVWADRYDRSLEDVFQVQDELTNEIVGVLQVKLSDAERAEVDRIPTDNLEAYDLYQRAVLYANRFNREANLRARELLQKAIELDPEFGGAYGELAGTYVAQWYSHWTTDPTTPSRAAELMDRALELDDSFVPSLIGAVGVYSLNERNDDARRAADRAVMLAPNSASAHGMRGSLLMGWGQYVEALSELEAASRLDPFEPQTSFRLGFARFLLREYDEAVTVLSRGIVRTPDFIALHGVLALTYAEMGRAEDARREAAEVHRISPDFSRHELLERNFRGADDTFLERVERAAKIAGL